MQGVAHSLSFRKKLIAAFEAAPRGSRATLVKIHGVSLSSVYLWRRQLAPRAPRVRVTMTWDEAIRDAGWFGCKGAPSELGRLRAEVRLLRALVQRAVDDGFVEWPVPEGRA